MSHSINLSKVFCASRSWDQDRWVLLHQPRSTFYNINFFIFFQNSFFFTSSSQSRERGSWCWNSYVEHTRRPAIITQISVDVLREDEIAKKYHKYWFTSHSLQRQTFSPQKLTIGTTRIRSLVRLMSLTTSSNLGNYSVISRAIGSWLSRKLDDEWERRYLFCQFTSASTRLWNRPSLFFKTKDFADTTPNDLNSSSTYKRSDSPPDAKLIPSNNRKALVQLQSLSKRRAFRNHQQHIYQPLLRESLVSKISCSCLPEKLSHSNVRNTSNPGQVRHCYSILLVKSILSSVLGPLRSGRNCQYYPHFLWKSRYCGRCIEEPRTRTDRCREYDLSRTLPRFSFCGGCLSCTKVLAIALQRSCNG